MLDVLHFLFEDDLLAGTGEQLEAKDKLRSNIYKEFYNSSYRYAASKSSASNYDYGFENLDDPVNIPASQAHTKPYFPPTNFDPEAANPFGSALKEAPLG